MVFETPCGESRSAGGISAALPVFRHLIAVVVAVGMWESPKNFQGVWEGWKDGFTAFRAFHAPSFAWLVFGRSQTDRAEKLSRQSFLLGKMIVPVFSSAS